MCNVYCHFNSVWPNEDNSRFSLSSKLALVKTCYQRQTTPTGFQICPMVQPNQLDKVLAEPDYGTDTPTNVQMVNSLTILHNPTTTHSVTISTNYEED